MKTILNLTTEVRPPINRWERLLRLVVREKGSLKLKIRFGVPSAQVTN